MSGPRSSTHRLSSVIATEEHFRQILDIADDAIISIDETQRIVLFNQGAERMFGYSLDEVQGRTLDILLPQGSAEAHHEHVNEFDSSSIPARRMAARGQISGRRKNGSEFPAEASISKVTIDGSRIYTVMLRDITHRKQTEEHIRSSLREKEILLQEVHHRVKNNLQVVSSLLRLQERGIDDPQMRQLFKESQNRVQSMALIHEQLYKSDSLAAIDFPDYLRQLIAHLFGSYQVSSSRIASQTHVADVHLGVDDAVPCGLILNELLSNALKYAFPDGREGLVRIELSEQDAQGQLSLTVADDGVGLPEDIAFWNTQTLGLRLVRSLVRQLDGDVKIDRSQGTCITVTFKPEGTSGN